MSKSYGSMVIITASCDCVCLYSATVAAAEAAACNAGSPVYSLSRQATIASARCQLYWSTFDSIIQPNMNTSFGPLLIQIEYSVQPE